MVQCKWIPYFFNSPLFRTYCDIIKYIYKGFECMHLVARGHKMQRACINGFSLYIKLNFCAKSRAFHITF